MAVKDRYVSMLREHPEDKKLEASIQNFEEALTHPDSEDLEKLSEALDELKLS